MIYRGRTLNWTVIFSTEGVHDWPIRLRKFLLDFCFDRKFPKLIAYAACGWFSIYYVNLRRPMNTIEFGKFQCHWLRWNGYSLKVFIVEDSRTSTKIWWGLIELDSFTWIVQIWGTPRICSGSFAFQLLNTLHFGLPENKLGVMGCTPWGCKKIVLKIRFLFTSLRFVHIFQP